MMEEDATSKLVVFKGKNIRRLLHNTEWYFSVTDIIEVLTESPNARRYWSDLKRGVQTDKEYSILTAEISKATFGMTPSEYKQHKGLKRENLRDHMNDLELIFTMLGEASTTEIARNKDTKSFVQNKHAAQAGGKIAGDARKQLERESGKPVITKNNFLPKATKPKKLG